MTDLEAARPSAAQPEKDRTDFLRGGGEMGALIRGHDWGPTSIGEPANWPQPLRTALRFLLNTAHPMYLWWGPDLLCFYNDACRQSIGSERHPGSLGQPARRVWDEIWPSIGPQIDQVMSGGGATWQVNGLAPITRNGRRQDVSWTCSSGPIDDETAPSGVGGVVVICTETTGAAQADQRPATPNHLAERAVVESEERLRLAIEVAKLATWDWDLLTGEVVWSEEHYRMEGYVVGEVVPSFDSWSARVHPDDLAGTLAALEVARAEGGLYAHTFRFRHPNGRIVWVTARARYLYNEGGAAVRMIGLMDDITDARLAEDRRRELLSRQDMLVAELQHRTRNLIGVVRSIAGKTINRSGDLAAFRTNFNHRLSALSRVQGLLSRADEERITFRALVTMEVDALGGEDMRDRITLEGPEVRLRSSTVQTLALALHELATNAVRHGSLGHPDGRLRVNWSVVEGAHGVPRLAILWVEEGVGLSRAEVSAAPQGYGRELIERALPFSLDARTSFELSEVGLLCSIEMPLDRAEKGPLS